VRAFFTLAILAATCLPAQDGQSGPTQLIVTYRCPPPRRAAFRQYMTEYGIQRFDRWKQDGTLKDYKFLFNWYIDVDTWDAMAILNFPTYAAVAKWKDIEKTSPGGLSRDALDMAWPLTSYSSDLVAHEGSDIPVEPVRSVFFILSYDGQTWRDAAVAQAKAFLKDGSISSYSAYGNRYTGGKRWRGMLLLEFKDMDAFARFKGSSSPSGEREPVIADSIGH
jgi:hypothetical protein